jgi:hypothetical protein
VCAKCEKPFLGNRHYEKKGLAYCETHYHQLFGNLCFVCNQVIGGDGKAFNIRSLLKILTRRFFFQYLPRWTRPGVSIILLARFVTQKCPRKPSFTNSTWNQHVKNVLISFRLNFGSVWKKLTSLAQEKALQRISLEISNEST